MFITLEAPTQVSVPYPFATGQLVTTHLYDPCKERAVPVTGVVLTPGIEETTIRVRDIKSNLAEIVVSNNQLEARG